jgi:hypothetical protein
MASRVVGEKRVGGIQVAMVESGLQYQETYEYLVETDDKNTGRADVLLTSGIPILYVTQCVGGPAICDLLTADRDVINPLYWHVKAHFSSDINEGDDGSKQAGNAGLDPTEWTSLGKIRFERYDEIMARDSNDKEFVNSAKQPFEHGIAIPRTIACIDFVQFEPTTTNLVTIMERNGVTNSDNFQGAEELQLLLTVNQAERGFYYGVSCWLIYYSIKFKRDDWRLKKLNVGQSYWDGTKLLPYERNGIRITGGLTVTGERVAEGVAPSIEYFEPYPQIEFTPLLRLT